jgi:hypothetical protein
MSNAILKDVNTIYHTGQLNYKAKIPLGIVGFVGITALVVGILALLNSQGVLNLPGLGAIPQQAIYAMLGVGGALLFAALIAFIVLGIKHAFIKSKMNEVINDDLIQPSHNGVSQIENMLKFSNVEAGKSCYCVKVVSARFAAHPAKIYLVAELVGESKTLHIFETAEQGMAHARTLSSNNFVEITL